MTKHRATFAVLVWALAIIMPAKAAQAYDAIVSWYPVPGAAGYRVYVRESTQSYGAGTDVRLANSGPGGVRNYRVTGLRPDRTTYFALSSYSSTGAASGLSNELSLRVNSGGTSGSLVVERVRVVCDTASARENGRLKLRALVNDADASGMFQQAAAGALAFTVQDAGAFGVTFDLSTCQSSRSVRCTSADRRARAKIQPLRHGAGYRVTIQARHLTSPETGLSPAAPVSVTLHQGSTLDRSAAAANCTGHGSRTLQCTP